jgi:hypothetical protein
MTTELDLDLQPAGDAFETVFRLPDEMPDDIRAMHSEMITRMRNESRAVSAGTNVLILIERMAWFYASMKNQELHPTDEPLSMTKLKELSEFWLKMHAEYNRLITSAESRSRLALLEAVQEMLDDSLVALNNEPEKQQKLRMAWAAGFEKLGL